MSAGAKALGGQQLTPEEQQAVERLKARDAEVHAHEAAHMASAGAAGGGASYTYELGPDGRLYAVGGEVPVSLRSGSTPDETIANAERVQRAALAPASPSSQDLAVAGMAARMIADARAQKAREASRAYEKVRGRLTGDDATGEARPGLPSAPAADAEVEPGLAA
ncbi:MAG: putative metalloprotease CJM1_0395 family protein [Anaeromyxobacteraceae bacterium]